MKEQHHVQREEIAKSFVLECEKTSALEQQIKELKNEISKMAEQSQEHESRNKKLTRTLADTQILKLRLSEATKKIEDLDQELEFNRQMAGKLPPISSNSDVVRQRKNSPVKIHESRSYLPNIALKDSTSTSNASESSMCRMPKNTATLPIILPNNSSKISLFSKPSSNTRNLPQNTLPSLFPTPPSQPCTAKQRKETRRSRRLRSIPARHDLLSESLFG